MHLPAADCHGPDRPAAVPLNPAYGLLLNFRLAVLGDDLDWYALGVSSAMAWRCCWSAVSTSAAWNGRSPT